MAAIHPCDLPGNALLRTYLEKGAYTDCYVTHVACPVSHSAFVEAFYTSGLFKIERTLLALAVAKPSTDRQARELSAGTSSSFAVWNVEARAADQLLLADLLGRTRSWLMSVPAKAGTRLYFGSAVVPVASADSGKPRMGVAFHALRGFHRLYSRALLRAAASRLGRLQAARP